MLLFLVNELRIETGRWQGKPLEERLCLVCNRRIVEDDSFLCECQTYSALCEDLFKSINEFGRVLKIWNLEKSLYIKT